MARKIRDKTGCLKGQSEMYRKDYKQILTAERLSKNLSYAVIASRMKPPNDRSPNAVADVFRGKNFSPTAIRGICEVLNIDFDEMLRWE